MNTEGSERHPLIFLPLGLSDSIHGPRQLNVIDFPGLGLTNAHGGSHWQCQLSKLTTHSRGPPVYSNSMLAALMGICRYACTETLTITSLVTTTCIC